MKGMTSSTDRYGGKWRPGRPPKTSDISQSVSQLLHRRCNIANIHPILSIANVTELIFCRSPTYGPGVIPLYFVGF